MTATIANREGTDTETTDNGVGEIPNAIRGLVQAVECVPPGATRRLRPTTEIFARGGRSQVVQRFHLAPGGGLHMLTIPGGAKTLTMAVRLAGRIQQDEEGEV